jgi:hypothetical protein
MNLQRNFVPADRSKTKALAREENLQHCEQEIYRSTCTVVCLTMFSNSSYVVARSEQLRD